MNINASIVDQRITGIVEDHPEWLPEGHDLNKKKSAAFVLLCISTCLEMPLDEAVRCCLISFDSTLRSNVSVGMPLDTIVYKKDSLHIPNGKRIYEEDPYFRQLSKQWSDTLRRGVQELPIPTNDYLE